MLSLFRRGITSKIMLVVLAIGLFAIVITGFGTGGMGGIGPASGSGATIGTAGGEKVTAVEVQRQVERQLALARQQQPDLDMATFLNSGILERIVGELLSAKALLSFARDAGFGVSKEMVDSEIASIPAFRNVAGQFDNNVFRQTLAREGITEEELREEIELTLIRQQVLAPVAAAARVPQGVALQYASLLLERRRGSVGLVPAAAVGEGAAPTDQEIAAYYSRNRSRYMVPERRVIRYAIFGTEQLGDAARPTDAEIAAYYRQNAANYAARETRTLSQVVLQSREAAQTFAGKLARGTSFDQAAAEAGFSRADTSLGEQTREQFANLASEAVANAAFGAAQGSVTQPVQSEFGWHIVRVDAINRIPARPLAAVRDEIAQQLGAQKRQDAIADLVARVEDAIADGASIEEAARNHGLQLRESPPVTASGTAEGGTFPPELAPVLPAAFELSPDEDPVVETISEGERFALLTVGRVIPAAPAPLAQIRDRVRADFIRQRAQDRARAVANGIVARINGGMTPAQAFAQAGVRLPAVEQVDTLRRDIARTGQVPPPLAMLFSMKRGTARLLPAPNDEGWFVVHLAETQAGNASGEPGLVDATRTQLSEAASGEYAQQFIKAIERSEGVKRNEEAIAALRRRLQGSPVQ